jgi:hypothetical protein
MPGIGNKCGGSCKVLCAHSCIAFCRFADSLGGLKRGVIVIQRPVIDFFFHNFDRWQATLVEFVPILVVTRKRALPRCHNGVCSPRKSGGLAFGIQVPLKYPMLCAAFVFINLSLILFSSL